LVCGLGVWSADKTKGPPAIRLRPLLLMWFNLFQLYTHPKTAGASKKAKAKKEKVAKAVLVCVHINSTMQLSALCQACILG